MRFSQVFDILGETVVGMRARILPLFALTVAVEIVALFAFEVDRFAELLTQPAIGLDQLMERSSANPTFLMGLALVLVLASSFQLGLWRPLRSIVLEGEDVTLKAAARDAAYRAVPAFLTINIINIITMLTVLVALLVGATVALIPQYMTFFVLFPAVYLVVARERAILNALGDSVRWTVSLRWGPWLLGVQALSVVLGALVSKLADTLTLGLGLTEAQTLPIVLAGGYATYKFVQFVLFSTVFLAVDADEEAIHA